MLDCELSMQHVSKVISICFFHIRRLKQIRLLVGPDVTATLVSAFVLSRLDYCNAVLSGLPKSTIAPLQRAQNAAARLVKCIAPHDHITTELRDLHWLPVQYRINYKLCSLMHLIHTGQAPSYLADTVTQTATDFDRAAVFLMRNHAQDSVSATRFLICATPAAWNSLLSALHQLTDTELFQQAFCN